MDSSSSFKPVDSSSIPLVSLPSSPKTLSHHLTDLSSIFRAVHQVVHDQSKSVTLKEKITHLKELETISKQKIATLQSHKEDSSSLVEKRTTGAFFQIWKEKTHLASLKQQQRAVAKELQAMKPEELHQQQELLVTSIEQIQKTCSELVIDDTSSIKDLQGIFGLEDQLRTLLSLKEEFSGKKDYQQLYDDKIFPLVKQAKELIKKPAFQIAIRPATDKGKAAHAGLSALDILSKEEPVLKNSDVSVQEVYLKPHDQPVVLKKSHKRAAAEERLMSQLLAFHSISGVVGAFDIEVPAKHRFGMVISQAEKERGYAWTEATPAKLQEGIKRFLTPKDKLLVEKYQTMAKENNPDLENYRKVEGQILYGKFSEEEEIRETSLAELQALYMVDHLPVTVQIGFTLDTLTPLTKHIEDNTSLFRAVSYLPTLHKSPLTFYFTPNLISPPSKKAYELCERCQWSYKARNGKPAKATFHDLHILFLQGLIYEPTNAIIPTEAEIKNAFKVSWSEKGPDLTDPKAKKDYQLCQQFQWSYTDQKGKSQITSFSELHQLVSKGLAVEPMQPIFPGQKELRQALGVRWNVISPELVQLKKGDQIAPLREIQAKPFVDMVLMSDLQKKPRALENALKKLTEKAQLTAVSTLTFQFVDLHSGNLGIVPTPSVEYSRFKDLTFTLSLSSVPLTFKKLHVSYLNGEISLSTQIQFEENGQMIKKSLRELPDLQKALESPTELVIFDEDLSLEESSELQTVSLKGVPLSLLPLRNVLLESQWKSDPFSDTVIQALLDNEENNQQMHDWIQKKDAPIYQRLPEDVQNDLGQLLAPILETYSLSEARRKTKEVTLSDVQKQFTQDICDMTKETSREIWKTIERGLSFVPILPGDTLTTLAKRYGQSVEELRRLNPSLELEKGKNLKILYDVTSSAPHAIANREELAPQLFPRLTVAQQKALSSRQENLKIYIKNHQKIVNSSLTGKELIKQLKEYIKDPQTPVTSIERQTVLETLKNLGLKLGTPKSASDLDRVRKEIGRITEPTFFNIAQVMYSLLGDSFDLVEALEGGDGAAAGKAIGLYSSPLEHWITLGLANSDPDIQLAAQELQKKIKAVRAPSFLGMW